jgi:hypothetical protein
LKWMPRAFVSEPRGAQRRICLSAADQTERNLSASEHPARGVPTRAAHGASSHTAHTEHGTFDGEGRGRGERPEAPRPFDGLFRWPDPQSISHGVSLCQREIPISV